MKLHTVTAHWENIPTAPPNLLSLGTKRGRAYGSRLHRKLSSCGVLSPPKRRWCKECRI